MTAGFVLSACASIVPVGYLGPKQLPVYSISHNDFLSADRMLVVLDKYGNVKAYSGGTVAGPGAVGLQTAGTLATAGAIVYGAKSIENGARNIKVRGIPSNVSLKGIPSEFTITGKLDHLNK